MPGPATISPPTIVRIAPKLSSILIGFGPSVFTVSVAGPVLADGKFIKYACPACKKAGACDPTNAGDTKALLVTVVIPVPKT